MLIFKNKNVFLWILASTITVLGDFFFSTIIPVVTYNLTNSAEFAVLVVFLDILPIIVFSPFIGYIVDKYNKKKLIIISNITSGIILIFLCLIPPNPWIYLLANSLVSILALIYTTTAKTTLPLIMDDIADISRVNSFLSLNLEVAGLVGAALAGIVITFFPYKILFFIDALSFFGNIILVVFISISSRTINNETITEKESFSKSFKNTFNYIKSNSNFRKSTFYYSLFFFLRGIIFSQIVVFLISGLMLGNGSYALFQNIILVGVLVTQLFMAKYRLKNNPIKWIRINLVMASFYLILLSVVGNIYIMIGFGISQAVIINMWYTNFYITTPENIRGKLLSLSSTVFELCRLIGIGCVGITITFISIRQSFIIFSVITIIIVLIFVILEIFSHKNFKKFNILLSTKKIIK